MFIDQGKPVFRTLPFIMVDGVQLYIQSDAGNEGHRYCAGNIHGPGAYLLGDSAPEEDPDFCSGKIRLVLKAR